MTDLYKNITSYIIRYRSYIIVGAFGFLAMYLNWRVRDVVALVFLVWLVVEVPQPKLFALGTVWGLIGVALLLAINRTDRAEQAAKIVFILFAVTIVLHVYHSFKMTTESSLTDDN